MCISNTIYYMCAYLIGYIIRVHILWDISYVCIYYGIYHTCAYIMGYIIRVHILWDISYVCIYYGIYHTCAYIMKYIMRVHILWDISYVCIYYGIYHTCAYIMEYIIRVHILWNSSNVCIFYGKYHTCAYFMGYIIRVHILGDISCLFRLNWPAKFLNDLWCYIEPHIGTSLDMVVFGSVNVFFARWVLSHYLNRMLACFKLDPLEQNSTKFGLSSTKWRPCYLDLNVLTRLSSLSVMGLNSLRPSDAYMRR